MALSVTTQRLESCFSPLLDMKGYHGSPEQRAQRSKVALDCSLGGAQREGARDLNLSCSTSGVKVVSVLVSLLTTL